MKRTQVKKIAGIATLLFAVVCIVAVPLGIALIQKIAFFGFVVSAMVLIGENSRKKSVEMRIIKPEENEFFEKKDFIVLALEILFVFIILFVI